MQTVINGIRLEYEKHGSGDPILLLHGWNGRKESLKPLGMILSDSFEVYLLDLPGFGNSSIPPESWGMDDYVDTITQFIKEHKLGCLNLIGHSFGGGIGMKIAFENSVMLKSLILINSAFYRDPTSSKAAFVVNKIPFYNSIKDKLVLPRKAYYKVFHPSSDALKRPELEKIYRRIITEDIRDLVPQIKTRSLVLWGDKDLLTPITDAYFLRDNLEDVEIEVFKGEAHNLPLVAPEKVAPHIKKFILKH